MSKLSKKEQQQKALRVGRIASMMRNGYAVTEIASKLNLNESTVRSYEQLINDYASSK